MIGETRAASPAGKPLDQLDDSRKAGPVRKITLLRRRCLSCGDEEVDADGRPLYYPPLRLPRDTMCPRCGTKTLIPGDLTTFYYRLGPTVDMRQYHKTGRPSKAWLAQQEAERLARETDSTD